jgi:BirA family biotin operon repressor/biotin-[acetyl-CoA-carboxylase] ligase
VYKILAKLPFKTNHVHYLPSCHSTNEVAQDLLQAEAEEGTIVITDNQFAGKGQRGNVWLSKSGMNLTFSLVLRPIFLLPNEQFFITVAISLAIKEALEEQLSSEVKIKWPNDIYCNNKKIAGLLIENVLRGNRFDSCVIGLGLNINQTEFESSLLATSMKNEGEKSFDLNKVLNVLIGHMADFYYQLKKGPRKRLHDKYHQALLGMGEERQFELNGRKFAGIIIGTDEFGQLLIRSGRETLIFQHKEVKMLF